MIRRYIYDAADASRATWDLRDMRLRLRSLEEEGDEQKENAAQLREEIEALQAELDLFFDDGGDGTDGCHNSIHVWL